MDLQMKAEDMTGDYPIWDVKVEDGLVPIVKDEKEDIQSATLACFLERGTIPQLPDIGVPWTEFLMGNITFADLDVEIRQSIQLAGMDEYRPQYQIENDKLTLVVTKEM